MRNICSRSFAAALLFAILPLAPAALRADFLDQAQTEDQARALLTKGSGRWYFKGASWAWVRVFKADGTISTEKYSETGRWKISDGKVVITFKSGQANTLTLPVDPAGTSGLDAKGKPMVVTRVDDGTQAAPTPTPSALASLQQPPGDFMQKLAGAKWMWKNKGPFSFDAGGVAAGLGPNFHWSLVKPYGMEYAFGSYHGTITFAQDLMTAAVDEITPSGQHAPFTLHRGEPQFAAKTPPPGTEPKPDNRGSSGGDIGNPFGSSSVTGGAAQGATPPPAPQPAAAAVSPEMQQKAADLVKAYHNDLVFVTGRDGAGSGFIAALDKANLLFTNAHVAAAITDAGFKTLDDATIQPGAAAVAVGRDVFSIAQPAGGTPFEIMQDVGSNAGIGDDVVVLGNAEGEGVINTIMGKIVGIGADRIEVDAPFVPGNSGSPIVHLKTGKVIGVATYLVINNYDDVTNEKNAKPVIRRFGYRIDNIKQWQAVDWRAFRSQAAEMDRIETLTDDLYDFFRDMHDNKGSVTPERHTNPVIKNRIDQWQSDKAGKHSAADQNMANANFLSFLKVACQADVTAAKQRMAYDYFQRKLANQQQARDEMSKAFEEAIKNIQN